MSEQLAQLDFARYRLRRFQHRLQVERFLRVFTGAPVIGWATRDEDEAAEQPLVATPDIGGEAMGPPSMITLRRLREVIARREVRAAFKMQLAGKLMGQRLHVLIPGFLRRFDGLVIELRSQFGIAVQSPQFGFEQILLVLVGRRRVRRPFTMGARRSMHGATVAAASKPRRSIAEAGAQQAVQKVVFRRMLHPRRFLEQPGRGARHFARLVVSAPKQQREQLVHEVEMGKMRRSVAAQACDKWHLVKVFVGKGIGPDRLAAQIPDGLTNRLHRSNIIGRIHAPKEFLESHQHCVDGFEFGAAHQHVLHDTATRAAGVELVAGIDAGLVGSGEYLLRIR